jgi:GTP-binding protein
VNKVLLAARLQKFTRCEQAIARRSFASSSLTASNAFDLRTTPSRLYTPIATVLSNSSSVQLDSTTALFSTAAAEIDQDEDITTSSSSSYTIKRRQGVRNVAIVAHVDHGKTTLVDELLKVAAASSSTATSTDTNNSATEANDSEGVDLNRLMDSGELEKERGITITSKVTRLDYTANDGDGTNYIINVVDTPGHADFAGEVDRILSTVDGVVLVVDAGEGPKAQTKYVLSRALGLGLKPIVVLNKADRPESLGRLETGETELELMDLFEALGADENQMEYRTLFGSARGGWVTDDVDVAVKIANDGGVDKKGSSSNMRGLLKAILEDIPAPSVHWYSSSNDLTSVDDFGEEPFSMTATTVGMDPYLGRTCTGRIYSGKINISDSVTLLRRQSERRK